MAKKKATNDKPEKATAEAVEAATAEQENTAEAPAEAAAELEAQLAAAREETSKNWDLYLRSQAELENYRKRVQRDRQDLLKFGNENILRELLPVIDNLDRAVAHAREAGDQDQQGLLEGVEMTLGQFHKVLDKFHVTPINALGEPFDPARHEAMGQFQTSDYPPNTVAQELQKGYLLHDRLLRPAMVMIASAPPAEAAATNDEPSEN